MRPLYLTALLVVCVASACQVGPTVTPRPTQSLQPTAAPTAPPTAVPTATPAMAPTDAPTDAPTAAAFPMELVDDEGTTVELAAEPERVISLTPATTELMFALGEGDKLVARGEFDDYPPEAVELPAVASFTGVVIEQVVDLEPDLVLAGGNNFTPAADVSRLRDLGIPVLALYAEDVGEVLGGIELVGRAIGAETAAQEMMAAIQLRVDEVAVAVADLERPRVFYEIGYLPEIYAPAPNSFVADMVAGAGGEPITTSDPTVFSIALEQLVNQDPQVIVLGDSAYPPPICPDSVVAREGWDGMTAVVNGDIRPVNDIIVTRPGPRIGEGLAALALAIHPEADIAPPEAGTTLCEEPAAE